MPIEHQSRSRILGYLLLLFIALGGSALSVYMAWSFWEDLGAPGMIRLFSLIQGALAILALVAALSAFWILSHRI